MQIIEHYRLYNKSTSDIFVDGHSLLLRINWWTDELNADEYIYKENFIKEWNDSWRVTNNSSRNNSFLEDKILSEFTTKLLKEQMQITNINT